MPLTSHEIRKRFLDFFEKKGHKILPSSSLVPENDASVLFTTAGMQPLVPYLMGEKHPLGNRLANVQKCVRLQDIEEVGEDAYHDTFFEMLGNWSLGDYFKERSLPWSWEFLTNGDYGLGIDPQRLYVTVFEGNGDVSADEDSIDLWKELFAIAGIDARVYGKENLDKIGTILEPSYRIFPLGKNDNWWPAGGKHPGPQGPDSEIFYYWKKDKFNPEKERPGYNDKDNFWEIWNNVFMEYNRQDEQYYPLDQKNVDTGMGLERVSAVMIEKPDIFLTDLFEPIMKILEQESNIKYGKEKKSTRAMRIIADHLRTATFIMGDDAKIAPSNLGRGYVLRRLIRRSLRYQNFLGINRNVFSLVAKTIVENYGSQYDELGRNFNFILEELKNEEGKFQKTLKHGLKEWEKMAKKGSISGIEAFYLLATFGFPYELTEELANEKCIKINKKEFDKAFLEHQKISRDGADKAFRGGLIDNSYETVKLHTATHLLQATLRKILGNHVEQKGSNITPDRLRFDFSHTEKLKTEEKNELEKIINEIIQKKLPISFREMPYQKAIARGALGFFRNRYEEIVKVYIIGDEDSPFSMEICNGPHVSNTSELGRFRIVKEEALGSGIRRIKAILEN